MLVKQRLRLARAAVQEILGWCKYLNTSQDSLFCADPTRVYHSPPYRVIGSREPCRAVKESQVH
jgi:hypothetical protein